MNPLMKLAYKPHYTMKFQGMEIVVENRKGSYRRGTDTDGNEWATKMINPYGFIKGYMGTDGDELDCFVGPHRDSSFVAVVHIVDPETGKDDEDKVFLGFRNMKEVMASFKKHYDDWEKFFGSSTEMEMDEFRGKLWKNRKKPRKLDKKAGLSRLVLRIDALHLTPHTGPRWITNPGP